jgi:hypothetical protein
MTAAPWSVKNRSTRGPDEVLDEVHPVEDRTAADASATGATVMTERRRGPAPAPDASGLVMPVMPVIGDIRQA